MLKEGYLPLTHKEKRPELYPSETEIPQMIIDLVNASASKAFPTEFGTLLKPLSYTNILIIKDMQTLLSELEKDIHPLVNDCNDKIKKALPLVRKIRSQEAVSEDCTKKCTHTFNPGMVTLPEIYGSPIIVSEDILSYEYEGRREEEDCHTIRVSRLLLHEYMHHCANGKKFEVNSEDNLFKKAFFREKFFAGEMSSEIGKLVTEERINVLENYATSNISELFIQGVQIALNSQDSSGKMKRIATSGHDLNETIVEYLAKDAVLFLLENTGWTDDNERKSKIRKIIINPAMTSKRSGMYMPYIGEILEELQLTDKNALLKSYVNGEIPGIFSAKHPGWEYFI